MDKFITLCLLFGITLLIPVTSAYASGKSDMFGDYSNNIYNTSPLMTSDIHQHHGDMFGPPNMYAQTGADVFGHVRPPPDYGAADMFKAHIHSPPDDPLYNWPRNRTYP